MGLSLFLFIIMVVGIFFTYARYVSIHALLVKDSVNSFKKDYTWQPKVSIMLSAFKEGEAVAACIRSIMASDYPKDKIEIVAIDDCSPDDTHAWMLKLKEEFPDNLIVDRNEQNLGKTLTLVKIAKRATGEIFISIDSDAIFNTSAIKELVACYADPDVGAVGGQVRILNVNDSLWSQFQAMLYVFAFYLYKPVENQIKASRCLSGPLVSFRAHIYKKFLPIIPQRNFLGQWVTYGEDSYLTILTCFGIGLDRSWKVMTELKAIAWVGTPTTYTSYFNQQVRWIRGNVVNAFFTFTNFFGWTMKRGVIPTWLQMSTSMTICLTVAMIAYLMITGQFLVFVCHIVLFGAIWGAINAYCYNLTIGRDSSIAEPIKNPIRSGVIFGIWLPVSWLLVRILSTFTLDDGGWVTRQSQGNTQ